MRTVFLNEDEIDALDRLYLEPESDGGWKHLLTRLQQKLDRLSGCLHLDLRDLEQIPRFAFDYGNRDWEARLAAVFERTLGPQLGR